jgi:hypothetical protein
MNDVEALKALEEREKNTRIGISNLTRSIEEAQDALVRGDPPRRLVHFIRDMQESLYDHLIDLGRTEQKVDDLKARMREQDAVSGKDWFRRPEPELTKAPLDAKQQNERDWFRRGEGEGDTFNVDQTRRGRERS